MLKTSLRRRSVVATAVAGVLVATGGTAWAMWRLTGSGSSATSAASTLELRLTARPRPNKPLYPGGRTDLSVTVQNPNPFPILVTTVRVGTGPVTVDAAHRDTGCVTTGISPTRGPTAVSWPVPARSSATHLLLDAVQMTNASDSACQGAAFTIPLTASGKSNAHR